MTDTMPRPAHGEDRSRRPAGSPRCATGRPPAGRPAASPAQAPRIAAISRTIARPPAEPRRKMKSAVLNVPTRAASSGAGPIAIWPEYRRGPRPPRRASGSATQRRDGQVRPVGIDVVDAQGDQPLDPLGIVDGPGTHPEAGRVRGRDEGRRRPARGDVDRAASAAMPRPTSSSGVAAASARSRSTMSIRGMSGSTAWAARSSPASNEQIARPTGRGCRRSPGRAGRPVPGGLRLERRADGRMDGQPGEHLVDGGHDEPAEPAPEAHAGVQRLDLGERARRERAVAVGRAVEVGVVHEDERPVGRQRRRRARRSRRRGRPPSRAPRSCSPGPGRLPRGGRRCAIRRRATASPRRRQARAIRPPPRTTGPS